MTASARAVGVAERSPRARDPMLADRNIVVAQGYEAGGDIGEIASRVLGPEIVDAVGPEVQVLAARARQDWRQALAILGVLQQRFGAPSRKDWACTDLLQTHFPGLPKQTVQFWQQIGSGRAAAATDNQSGVSATTHMEKYCDPPP